MEYLSSNNSAAIVSETETNHNICNHNNEHVEHSDDDSDISSCSSSQFHDQNQITNSYNHDLNDDSNDDNNNNNNNDSYIKKNKYGISKRDPLYDPNGDDEDEAYVYKHLRGGIEEEENVVVMNKKRNQAVQGNVIHQSSQQKQQQQQQQHQSNKNRSDNDEKHYQGGGINNVVPRQEQQWPISQSIKILKPRTSDGILSCPCCFQIVCMDCQKHERYHNQFRAMFVMNIGVDWNVHVKPEDNNHLGKKKHEKELMMIDSEEEEEDDDDNHDDDYNNNNGANNRNNIFLKPIPNDDDYGTNGDNEVYYSVYCNNCRTLVAALDMRDEVYHFFGCILSG